MRVFCRWMLPILCLTALCATCSAAVVELRETARVETERIRLGEVAELDCTDEEAATLAELDLGPAPLPGGSRRLSAGYIKMRLRRCGVDCDEVDFAGAPAVQVHRPGAAPAPRKPPREGTTDGQDGEADRPAPVEIDRGTRIHLTVACGAVFIGAEATLLEDAVVGARAKMRVEQTRETVMAQIVRPTEAIIRGSERVSCAY